MMRFRLYCFLLSGVPVVLSILNNPIPTISGAYAQEQPMSTRIDSECLVIQGRFRNVGEDISVNKRKSRLPPYFASDVLSSGWPGKSIVEVMVERVNNTTFQFRFIEQSGEMSEALELKFSCQDGWWIFKRTVSGGAEGWHGTQTTIAQLSVAEDGSLLTHVIRNNSGKDFYLIPRETSEEFEYLFLKSTR